MSALKFHWPQQERERSFQIMTNINISPLTPLLQGLSERIQDLKKEFESLHIKVELTRDIWKKIEELYQQEGWDPSQKP